MVIANSIPVAVDDVDNNPANPEPKNHQQEMENGEDDNDSTDNEKEMNQKVKTKLSTKHNTACFILSERYFALLYPKFCRPRAIKQPWKVTGSIFYSIFFTFKR